MSDEKENQIFEVLEMPEWKSKVLHAVAWLLGFRGEDVHVITLSDSDE